MMLKMVKIMECNATDCVYNRERQCHTMGITIGSPCPMCDTYTAGGNKGGETGITGGIGACRQSDCTFNRSLECHAPGIRVGCHTDHADCVTFRHR